MLVDYFDRLSPRDSRWLKKKLGIETLLLPQASDDKEVETDAYLPVWTSQLKHEPAVVIFAVLRHLAPLWQNDFISQMANDSRTAIDKIAERGLSEVVLTLIAQQWLSDKECKFEVLVGEGNG